MLLETLFSVVLWAQVRSLPRIPASTLLQKLLHFWTGCFTGVCPQAGSLRLASSVPDGLANLNSLLGNPTYAGGGAPPPPPPPSVDRFHSPQISVFHWSLPTRKLHPHLVPPDGTGVSLSPPLPSLHPRHVLDG